MNEIADRLSVRAIAATVGLITLVGFALRLNLYGDSVFGDELSTLWIVQNHSFLETVSVVHGDAEITPPLYFLLAWLTTHLGSAPELVRLPALVAGTISIPLTYMFGLRTLGRATGVAAALVIAISPYLTFLSADGRGYALMIFFLLCSSLALLAALRTGKMRWWVAYAACACLAMYSHYTATFILVAQFAWVVGVHAEARKRALFAALTAALLFLPWVTGLINDLDSPTQVILEYLQGSGIRVKVEALTQIIAGEPMIELAEVPGRFGLLLVGFGLLVGLLGSAWRLWQDRAQKDEGQVERRWMLALVVATALATPVAELALLVLGIDLLSDRNLAAAWAGIPVLLGALFTLPPLRVGLVAMIATVGGLGIGAVKVTDRAVSGTAFERAAGFIESRAAPGDVVLDSSHYTPVPLTQLDAYLPQDHLEFRPGLPEGEPPFLPLKSVIRPRDQVVDEAFRAAGSNRVFLVFRGKPEDDSGLTDDGFTQIRVPRGWRPEEIRTWPGFVPVTVKVLVPDRPGSG